MRLNRTIICATFVTLAAYGVAAAQTGGFRPPTAQFQAGGAGCRLAIRGQKQGQFMSSQPNRGDKWMPCQQVLFSVASPRDVATGQASGRKQYAPVVVTKEWDAASPQIFTAAATNEVLPLVEFEFTRAAPDGREFVFESVRLTNASISSVKQHIGSSGAGDPPNPRELEDVSFTFQKIELTNTEGRTTFVDDWGR
jgi:type VI secretion system secreted protein Hcp